MSPPTPWPMGHAPKGLQVEQWVVGVDTSLSMQGFVQSGGIQPLLDTMRATIQGAQVPQATLQAHAIESQGLLPWSTGQQDAQSFLASLKHAPQRFNAPNNDLVSALRALGQQLNGKHSLALVLTDLIPSVKTDGSDATGVGLALAEWIQQGGSTPRGACLVRFDLPFAGLYYPEKPKGAPFTLQALRPIYLIILGPTPSASSSMAHALGKNWRDLGGAAEAMDIADLTPDLTHQLRIGVEDAQRTPGFEVDKASPDIRARRLGANKEWKLQVGTNLKTLMPEGATLTVAPIQDIGWTPKRSHLEVVPTGKKPDQWQVSYQADTNLRNQPEQEAFRVTWTAKTATPLPEWVKATTTDIDTPEAVLPAGARRIRTLNLLPILNAARSGAPQPASASTYVFVTKAK